MAENKKVPGKGGERYIPYAERKKRMPYDVRHIVLN